MSYDFLTIRKNGPVMTVGLNRPAERNALNAGLMRELTDLARGLCDDLQTTVVILTGSDAFFSAGMDLKCPEIRRALNEPLAVRRRAFEMGPRMCKAWEEAPQVTIAAVEGFCIGGAVSLVLSCDFRVMGENAYLKISEIDLGMNYSWGSMARLVQLAGPAFAKKWVILAEQVSSREAVESGFAQWAAPAGKAVQKAMEQAEKIVEKPQTAVFMAKQTVNALNSLNQAVGHMDVDQFALTVSSEDFQEGISAFMEKRKPRFNRHLGNRDKP